MVKLLLCLTEVKAKMSVFYVIDAAFFIIMYAVLYYVFDPISLFPRWITYAFFALGFAFLHQLLVRAKSKWGWLNKKIDPQLSVLLILAILLSPIIIDSIILLFGFRK